MHPDQPADFRLTFEADIENILSLGQVSAVDPDVRDLAVLTLLEFDRGVVPKGYALNAINALGSMGTHEAAERLSLHLELLNSYTEHSKVYDEQIVLSVLLNLMELGDKVAFPTLSYTQYLNYSDTIKKAAKDAIDNLKW